jgi:hypothetical protein
MRRIELLISHIRKATENQDVAGISTAEFVQYMNDAQDRLQSLITAKHPESEHFAAEGFINLSNAVEAYDLRNMVDVNGVSFKSRILASNSVNLVERTQGDSYFPLKMISSKERTNGYGYFLRNNDLILSPIAQGTVNKGLRVVYAKKLRDLSIRRGVITGVGAGSITLTTLGDATDFLDTDYICVVDRDGVNKGDSIAIDTWTPGTGVITTASSLGTAAIGDYVTYGEFSTTHSELPDTCERYLIAYVEMKIFMRDSSADATAQASIVQTMEADIVELFSDNTGDTQHIPISATDYMIW